MRIRLYAGLCTSLLFLTACNRAPLPSNTPQITNIAQTTQYQTTNSMANIVEQRTPSVVGIASTAIARGATGDMVVEGVGTGVIVDQQGYVLTNHHVAGDKRELAVVFSNGDTAPATALWSDAVMDLAIIRIDARGPFSVAPMGTSDQVRPGDAVFAIGTPLALQFQHTVTQGIISAKHRTLQIPSSTDLNFMEDLIQTDASINPGNSGGPLFDQSGQIVGINSIKVTQAEGLGFAIPIDVARPIVEHFMREGNFTTPYIGVFAIDSQMARYYDIPMKDGIRGLYVREVDGLGPAASIVRPGDIITQVDQKEVTTLLQLRVAMFKKSVGNKMALRILREDQMHDVTIELTAKPI